MDNSRNEILRGFVTEMKSYYEKSISDGYDFSKCSSNASYFYGFDKGALFVLNSVLSFLS